MLPQAIRTLSERYDGITVRVRDVVGARILELVKFGDVDFGMGTLTRPDPDVTADVLFKNRMCAFTPTGHAFARRRHVRLRDLARCPLILTGRDSSARQVVERALEQERPAVRVVQEATYMSTAIAMVRAGLGVAILPESAAAGTPDIAVCLVPIGRPAIVRAVAILARQGKSICPAAAGGRNPAGDNQHFALSTGGLSIAASAERGDPVTCLTRRTARPASRTCASHLR